MRIVVIGGSGFIGSHVTRRLLQLGHEVANFHRNPKTSDPELSLTEIIGDRAQLLSYRDEFQSFGPKIVIDMLALTESDAKHLVDTFADLAGRLVVISSADVYRAYELIRGVASGQPNVGPLTENSPLRENLYPYRASASDPNSMEFNYDKILVEKTALESQIPSTILRLPCVYGPGDHKHRLYSYLRRMDDGRAAIFLERDQLNWRWTRGYVENVAAGICSVVGDQSSVDRIYNLGEPAGLSEKDWIQSIGDVAGWNGRIIGADPAGLPKQMRTGMAWQHHLETDTALVRGDFGFSEPIPFQEGLERTVAWERANPPESGREIDYSAEDALLSLLS